MTPISVKDFADLCGGERKKIKARDEITGFATDSREVKEGDLFLAIKGEHADGHDYADEAIKRGAVGILATQSIKAPHILVKNLPKALAAFAKAKRKEFKAPVIGITGSAGKTTTKELTAAALGTMGPVLKSPGNRNTEYTSPLVWADATDEHKSAVIEMGMRGLKQIKHLASFSKPNIGIVTSIGTAHIEMVGSREGIMQAKAELLESLPKRGTAILWAEDEFLRDLKERSNAPVRTFGFTPDADCFIKGSKSLGFSSSEVWGVLDGVDWQAKLGVAGRHQALNAAAAVLAAATAGADIEEAAAQLEKADLPPMRLQAQFWRGATLVLDSYNASPDSTSAALRTLREMPCREQRRVVLGEMRELGVYEEAGHRLVGQTLAESEVEHVMLVGPATRFIEEEAVKRGMDPKKIRRIERPDLARVRSFIEAVQPGDVLLIKGSRALALERALPREMRR